MQLCNLIVFHVIWF